MTSPNYGNFHHRRNSSFVLLDSSFLQSSKHPPSQKVTFEKASHRGRFKRGLVVSNNARVVEGFFGVLGNSG